MIGLILLAGLSVTAGLPSALYPEWAHSHWVWLNHNVQSQSILAQLVEDYLAYDIPVGCVNIDSEWSTCENDFVWHTSVFPNASAFIDQMHALDVRVIAWATSMVDTDCPTYQTAKDAGYFLDDGLVAKWWHGVGSFIDYTNPKALDWWHGQLDAVLDIGLDGWKCDGTDAILFEWGGIAHGHGGIITEREYADMYYFDFFNHSRSRNPEALIMARPVDSWNEFYLDFQPKDTCFSGWVGDQDPTFSGLQDALRNMFHSAWRGYLNFGSDTGGYRMGNRTKETFIRWAQLSTFCPLFENGGEGEHRPWGFDNETVAIYRNFVTIHMELGPYFMSTAAERFAKGLSVMQPVARPTDLTPSSWEYLLGDDVFVAPFVQSGTSIDVTFPKGDDWEDWFSNATYTGGSKHTLSVPLDQFPVFRRVGSILPLNVSSPRYSALGAAVGVTDALTLLLTAPIGDGVTRSRDVYEWQGSGVTVSYTFDGSRLRLTATAWHRPLVFVVRGLPAAAPSSVRDLVGDRPLQEISASPSGSCGASFRSVERDGWCLGNGNLREIIVKLPTRNGASADITF